ncbi:hypothetical protein AAY473_016788 [Plecturocebus cupreus]
MTAVSSRAGCIFFPHVFGGRVGGAKLHQGLGRWAALAYQHIRKDTNINSGSQNAPEWRLLVMNAMNTRADESCCLLLSSLGVTQS